jgi:hypothetical protein
MKKHEVLLAAGALFCLPWATPIFAQTTIPESDFRHPTHTHAQNPPKTNGLNTPGTSGTPSDDGLHLHYEGITGVPAGSQIY